MNILKKFLCLLIILNFMIGVGGCMSGNNVKDKMISYMNETYDDTFTYYAPFGGEIGASSKEILVKSDKYPEYEIWVCYFKEGNEDVYQDNYIDYKYKEQTEKFFNDMLLNIFECPVILTYDIGSTGTHNLWDASVTFDEYITGALSFVAVVSDEYAFVDNNKITDLLDEYFLKERLNVSGRIYFASSQDNFKEIIDLNSTEIDKMKCLSFELSKDGKYEYKWVNV